MSACATAASPRSASLRTPPPSRRSTPRGLHVLPGLIDPHVHLRDPGDKAVETIPTGTRAAVLGGLAAVFDMPNTSPVDRRCGAAGVEAGVRRARILVRHRALCRRHQAEHSRTREAGTRPRRVRDQDLRRQLDRRPAGGGRRTPGARDALGPPAHRVSLRGRIPAAGAQAAVQVRRSVLDAHGMARRGDRLPRHASPDGAGARHRAAGAYPARVDRGGTRLPEGLPRSRDLRGAGEPPDAGGARLLRQR